MLATLSISNKFYVRKRDMRPMLPLNGQISPTANDLNGSG